ncbi:MAG: hypothetical protein ACRC0L_08395, partial [Angustibacter sp.]
MMSRTVRRFLGLGLAVALSSASPLAAHAAKILETSGKTVTVREADQNDAGAEVSEEVTSSSSVKDKPAGPAAAPAARTCADTIDNSFCKGTAECFTTKAIQTPDGKVILPGSPSDWTTYTTFPGEKPTKDAVAYYDTCQTPAGRDSVTAYWRTPGQTQNLALARKARAQLPFPKTTLAFSPNQQNTTDLAVVNTPTYWSIPDGPTTTIHSPMAGT